uniref:Peptidase S9, prolyl oligopeptidase active site domain protein n=1 Tax=Solibacter usitatus (strain Ellin6076) TaxID=234267 RepID=Q01WT9_SOLUE
MKLQIRVLVVACFAITASAQGTLADYQRGQAMQAKARGLVENLPGTPNWIGDSRRFWYSRSVKGGAEFLLVDAGSAVKRPAFDHEKLAAAINAASGEHYSALALPFAPATGGRGAAAAAGRGGGPAPGALTFANDAQSIEFGAAGFLYKCSLAAYQCTKGAALPAGTAGAAGRGAAPEDDLLAAPEVAEYNTLDGVEFLTPSPQQQGGQGGGFRRGQSGCANRTAAQGGGRAGRGGAQAGEPVVCTSFDGKWDALIENFNVFLRPAGSSGPATALSTDGSEGNYYTLRSVAWSPDSKKLAAYHTRPGYDRQVHYIESSPVDQVQPKHSTIFYRKPGDALDIAYPALFDVASKKEIEIDRALFPNAYDLTMPVWWKDGRGFTFEYNQRGHQIYRVIEVEANTGKARALITEESPTFIDYQLLPTGKRYRYNLDDGKEIIWGSERDGWEHLYLYDGVTGKVKSQITKGNWVLRGVDFVDEDKKQIWFQASGVNPEQDPYFIHYYRINFDGTGLTKLTEADGNHTVTYSKDRAYYVDSWSRVDLPTVSQLRRTDSRTPVMDLEKADASALLAAGMRMPEVFVAKGRDGKTDIWGTIVRPTNFDPAKKYPVIEQIYAGPQGSFVPKTFTPLPATQALAELGFIVVQIDGMGTNNRGKAFHNMAWKNLGDAGFPDRILWHKAAAAKYSWYDTNRVGIYGTSAGGQNAMGGMLFHPDFYKVAVTNSGCHDNRMDKIWWNELWMSWPIGPEYAAASNVDNAAKLQGRVLIVIGEMDSNVDPTSSLQVVNALVKANKHFDMMFIPGQNHGVPVLGSQHYLQDYFVHHLLGVEPPDWNHVSVNAESTAGGN